MGWKEGLSTTATRKFFMGKDINPGALPGELVENNRGTVVELLISAVARSSMVRRSEVRAVPGKGLEGDRYSAGIGTFSPTAQKPDFELTLIEQENLEAFAAQTALSFSALDARRNVVTRGVRLNDLVGREFCIGEVRIQGMRLCEPCNHLAKMSCSEVLQGLVHKGGLRAQILSEGNIHVGDVIRVDL
jgi:MOSC domain-containing protein YiiM